MFVPFRIGTVILPLTVDTAFAFGCVWLVLARFSPIDIGFLCVFQDPITLYLISYLINLRIIGLGILFLLCCPK